MTRTKARELAIRLIYAQAASDSETLLEDFLEPEHFESLASEDELFSEKPEGASLEYIRRLLGLCRERRAELAKDMDSIRDILHDGNKRANAIAEETLDQVREAMGMKY